MRKRKRDTDAKLEMTPMIDVVFQLLIFFIVSLKTPDILAQLDVSRPSVPDTPTPPKPNILTIEISKQGWVLNGRAFAGEAEFENMDQRLTRLASFNKHSGIMIKCTQDAPHAYLIRTLNICSREGLSNISLFSL